MNGDKETYKLVNKLLQEKVYTYDGPLTSYSGIKIKFNYKFKIVGDISLKHMGEPMNHLAIELIVVDNGSTDASYDRIKNTLTLNGISEFFATSK